MLNLNPDVQTVNLTFQNCATEYLLLLRRVIFFTDGGCWPIICMILQFKNLYVDLDSWYVEADLDGASNHLAYEEEWTIAN